MFLLPALKVIPHPSSDQMTLVASGTTLEAGGFYGAKKTVISEEIILKTLEDLKAENFVVVERLNNTEEMFKRRDEKTTRIEGMLGAILSRLPAPP